MICGQPVPALVSMNGITQRIIEPLYWFFDDVEVAKFAINTATIFEIKVTVALPFYSTLITLVAQWQKRNLPKSVLHLLKLFSLFNMLLFFFLVFRRCGCAEVANSDLIKNARQKLGPQAIADYYILVSLSEFVFFGPRLLMQVSFKQRMCLLLISLH